jgi:hypothetical protein
MNAVAHSVKSVSTARELKQGQVDMLPAGRPPGEGADGHNACRGQMTSYDIGRTGSLAAACVRAVQVQLVAVVTRGTGMRAAPVRVPVPLLQLLGGHHAGCCTAGVRRRAPIHARSASNKSPAGRAMAIPSVL